MKDPIVESVVAKMRIRSQAGIKEYGTTLADNPMKLIEWLNEAQAEAMDLALYLERIRQEINAKQA